MRDRETEGQSATAALADGGHDHMGTVCITVVTLLSFVGPLGAAFAIAGYAAVDYGRARENALAARARRYPIEPQPPEDIAVTGTPTWPVPRSGRNLS